MAPLDRWLIASRHFHGNWRSAGLPIRAWVLFHLYRLRMDSVRRHGVMALRTSDLLPELLWLHVFQKSSQHLFCFTIHYLVMRSNSA